MEIEDCHSKRYMRDLLDSDVSSGDGIILTDKILHGEESPSDFIEEAVRKGICSLLIIPTCSPLRPPLREGGNHLSSLAGEIISSPPRLPEESSLPACRRNHLFPLA